MAITIREYQKSDTKAIVDIINYNIVNSTALYDYSIRSITQQETIFESKIQAGFPIIVAENNGNVVGFGMYAEFRFREAYKFTVEHSVYINHKYQGLGIGKLLIKELIRLAKQQGLHTMIGVIDAENQNSINFHHQFGFKTVGIIKESGFKFNRWLDSVLVQLILE
jgi:phosphinothricin acetyltransferase